MTMEQLNNAVTDAQRAVAAVVAERTELVAKRDAVRDQVRELQTQESALFNEWCAMSDDVLKARATLRRAESALNLAVNNAIIAEYREERFGTAKRGMTQAEFLESLREVMRSKKPIAECLALRIERHAAGDGVGMEFLSYWAEDGRVRDLSEPQVRRLQERLD